MIFKRNNMKIINKILASCLILLCFNGCYAVKNNNVNVTKQDTEISDNVEADKIINLVSNLIENINKNPNKNYEQEIRQCLNVSYLVKKMLGSKKGTDAVRDQMYKDVIHVVFDLLKSPLLQMYFKKGNYKKRSAVIKDNSKLKIDLIVPVDPNSKENDEHYLCKVWAKKDNGSFKILEIQISEKNSAITTLTSFVKNEILKLQKERDNAGDKK